METKNLRNGIEFGSYYLQRIRGTFGLSSFKKAKCYFVQFSLKDPWLVPHIDFHAMQDTAVMAGWLFFYVGVMLLK